MSRKSQAKVEARRARKDKEIDRGPVSDELNVWHPDFGWVLKDGKPTQTSAAYWKMMRRELSK